MRIAFFTDTYLPNVDGVVNAIVNFKKELERRDHEVYIFSPGTKKQKEENKDPYIYFFPSASFKPYPDYRIALFNFLSPIRLIKDLNIDVIHSHGIATTSIAAVRSSQKLGIPAIASFHTLVTQALHYVTRHEAFKSVLENVSWQYLRWHYSGFKKVTVPTEFVRKILEAHDIKNTVVLPLGLNFKYFHKADPKLARKTFNFGKKPVIIHVGRIALEKRLEVIIDVAPSILNVVPDAIFVIAGKGPADNYYKDLVAKNSLQSHFVFTGYVDNENLRSLYAAADVFLFSSLFDTQGMAFLEAMAAGTPAVVSKQAAPAEFVKDGVNGYIFNDHFDLSEKIITAINNKTKLSQHAIETARNLDIKKTTDALLNLYASIGVKID